MKELRKRTCAVCKNIFIVEDRKYKFCSKLCSSRAAITVLNEINGGIDKKFRTRFSSYIVTTDTSYIGDHLRTMFSCENGEGEII